ncbi:MAG TPA: hypothetical protein VL346_08555 [Acidobacteriaceae bacterium]|nr:hypothetical protein [Acidobacteriaceae bacterium]
MQQFSSSAEHVYQRYLDLACEGGFEAQQGLGGTLVYAGELATSFSLLQAANIAGAASLAASADAALQRQARREGVVDFLVTSLDEALRILKNELRKRQPVSVGVSLEPEAITGQMLDRGVLPDLLGAVGADNEFLQQGARSIPENEAKKGRYLQWSVDRDFSRWMPLLDDCARSLLPAEDAMRQRWLRLAPRYLGRQAQRVHGVAMDLEEAARFRDAVEQMLAREVRESATAPIVSIDA